MVSASHDTSLVMWQIKSMADFVYESCTISSEPTIHPCSVTFLTSVSNVECFPRRTDVSQVIDHVALVLEGTLSARVVGYPDTLLTTSVQSMKAGTTSERLLGQLQHE